VIQHDDNTHVQFRHVRITQKERIMVLAGRKQGVEFTLDGKEISSVSNKNGLGGDSITQRQYINFRRWKQLYPRSESCRRNGLGAYAGPMFPSAL